MFPKPPSSSLSLLMNLIRLKQDLRGSQREQQPILIFLLSYFIAFFLALRDPIPSLFFTQMSLSLASISSTAKLDYLPLYCTCPQDTMPSLCYCDDSFETSIFNSVQIMGLNGMAFLPQI